MMQRGLNVQSASISTNAAMLLRIFGTVNLITYGVYGFLFGRSCGSALAALPDWITLPCCKPLPYADMKSRPMTLMDYKPLKWTCSGNKRRNPQQIRVQNSHACKKKLYGL